MLEDLANRTVYDSDSAGKAGPKAPPRYFQQEVPVRHPSCRTTFFVSFPGVLTVPQVMDFLNRQNRNGCRHPFQFESKFVLPADIHHQQNGKPSKADLRELAMLDQGITDIQELKDKAIKLRGEGMKYQDIAALLGLNSKTTIANWVHAAKKPAKGVA